VDHGTRSRPRQHHHAERAVLEAATEFVAFPAWDGEVGILRGRALLFYKLGAGRLRRDVRGRAGPFYIAGRLRLEDRLTILTQQAKRRAEIDRAAAERALTVVRETRARTRRPSPPT
jgi:F-type H+-transporting ATPase subunit epsilon